jgi:hypothetical protein
MWIGDAAKEHVDRVHLRRVWGVQHQIRHEAKPLDYAGLIRISRIHWGG